MHGTKQPSWVDCTSARRCHRGGAKCWRSQRREGSRLGQRTVLSHKLQGKCPQLDLDMQNTPFNLTCISHIQGAPSAKFPPKMMCNTNFCLQSWIIELLRLEKAFESKHNSEKHLSKGKKPENRWAHLKCYLCYHLLLQYLVELILKL